MATGHKDWFPVVVITGEIAGLFKNIAVDSNGNLKLSTGSFDGSGLWVSEGAKTAPSTGDLLADTGQLAAGFYRFDVYLTQIGTLASFVHELQHRNAANNANLKSMSFDPYGAAPLEYIHLPYYEIILNERMRIEVTNTHTTKVHACIFYWKYV